MITHIRPHYADATIRVSSGTGAILFSILGKLESIVIESPTDGSVFNYAITDVDGKPVAAKMGVQTVAVIDVCKLIYGESTLTLTGAAEDGAWTARFRYEKGI